MKTSSGELSKFFNAFVLSINSILVLITSNLNNPEYDDAVSPLRLFNLAILLGWEEQSFMRMLVLDLRCYPF